MAVDLEKFPIERGTGQHDSPRMSHSYPVLVGTDMVQTSGELLDDDKICYATSSSRQGVSAMCTKKAYKFGFENTGTTEDPQMSAVLESEVTGTYPKAGVVMYHRNAFRSSRYVFDETGTGYHTQDYCPPPIWLHEHSYANTIGSESAVCNNVSFITGFDWWYVFGQLMIVLCPFDSANNYFVVGSTAYPPSYTTVSYKDYLNTYKDNPNYKAIGAYLKVWASNNFAQKLGASPWCGYKTPSYFYGELDPAPTGSTMPATSHREFAMTSNTQKWVSFDTEIDSDNSGFRNANGGGVSTFPIVDPLFVTYAVRFFNGNSLTPRLTIPYLTTIAEIRGGVNTYSINEYNVFDSGSGTGRNKLYNGFVTEIDIDWILKAAASYGILITTDSARPGNDNFNTKAKILAYARNHPDTIYVPVPDKNGCYSGNYMELADFMQNGSKDISPFYPESDADLTNMKLSPDYSYDKAKGGGGEGSEDKEIDETPLNDVKLNTMGIFNRAFAVSQNDLIALADYIYNADDTIADAVLKGVEFMGDVPANALISLVQTPFDIPNFTLGGRISNIKLGRQTTTVQGVQLPSSMYSIFDFGSLEIPFPHQQYAEGLCFLDGEPYTTLTLYVPYVGMFELSTKEVIGKTLNVRLIIDWQTNSVCGCVFIGGILATYRTGTINTNVEMTAATRAVNVSQILSGIINTASGFGNIIASGGNPQMLSYGANQALQAQVQIYDGIAQPTQYRTVGATTSGNAMYLPPFAYVVLSTVKPNVPPDYGNSIGYACDFTGILSSFTGYVQCIGYHSSVGRTESENRLIEQALESGVIV